MRAPLATALLLVALPLSGCGDPAGQTSGGGTVATTTTAGGGGGSSTTTGGTGGGTSGGGTGGQSPCGNGTIDPGEVCDGAALGGYTCETQGFPGGQIACSPSCQLDVSNCTGSDACTDGTDNDGDGKTDCEEADCKDACESACFAPPVLDDGDDKPGSNVGHANALTSSCALVSGPEVAYAFTAAIDGILTVRLTEKGPAAFSLSVRSACGDDGSEIACTRSYAFGRESGKKLDVPVTQGQSLFILADGDTAAAKGAFTISAQTHPIACGDALQDPGEACDDGNTAAADGCSPDCQVEPTETEPNGSQAQANAFASPWFGEIAPEGDVDFVAIDLAAPGDLVVSTSGLGDAACGDGSMDSVVSILDAGGAVLATNDDAAAGTFCSEAKAMGLSAGTYYARVQAAQVVAPAAATFGYALGVQVQ